MKLIGCLSFYDESPAWLAASITSLARLGCTHIVAIDGAYFLLQGGHNRSDTAQHQAIIEQAHAHQLGLTIHIPETTWYGNEVEKRTFMFDQANHVADSTDDWYLVWDADQVATNPEDLKPLLAHATEDVAEVTFWEHTDPEANPTKAKAARTFGWDRDTAYTVRILFRAIPGLHLTTNHYTYATPDGRLLWGNAYTQTLEPALDLTRLEVEHRTQYRDLARHAQQHAYYKKREELGVERGDCQRCGKPASRVLPHSFELTDAGLLGSWQEVCEACTPTVKAENEATIRSHGLDPDVVKVDLTPAA